VGVHPAPANLLVNGMGSLFFASAARLSASFFCDARGITLHNDAHARVFTFMSFLSVFSRPTSFSVFEFRGLPQDWQVPFNPARPQFHSFFQVSRSATGLETKVQTPHKGLFQSVFSSFEGATVLEKPKVQKSNSICRVIFIFRIFLKYPDDERRSLVFVLVLIIFSDGLFLSAGDCSTGMRTS